MTEEEKKELDPLGIYTEEELALLHNIRVMPKIIKDAMARLAQDSEHDTRRKNCTIRT